MSEFSGVSVVKKANIYFDGKVTSRRIVFPDGSFKTLGIMLPGDYEFGTAQSELMEIQAGTARVLLPGASEYRTFGPGDSFNVPADSSFKLTVESVVDYICSYGV